MRYNHMLELDQRYKHVMMELRARGREDSVAWLRGIYQNEDVLKIEACVALMERRTLNDRVSEVYPSLG